MTACLVLVSCKPVPVPPAVATATPQSLPRATTTSQATLVPTPTLVQDSSIAVDLSELRGIKLRFWHTWKGASAEAINRLEARFNATNPWGVWVDTTSYSGYVELSQAVTENLGTYLSADLVAVPGEYVTTWNLNQEIVVELPRYTNDPAWGMQADGLTDLVPGIWQAYTGTGVPFGASARYLAYNQTWAEELGFTNPPVTLEDFREQACAAAMAILADRDPQNDGTGGWTIDSDPITILSWMAAFGGEVSFEGSKNLQFNSPPNQSAFTYLQSLFDEGCIWTARKSDHGGYLAGRQAILITASPQDIPSLAYAMESSENTDTWTLLPFPTQAGDAALVSSGPALSIIRTSDARQLAAWSFIRWLQEPQNQAQFLEASFSLPSTYSGLEAAGANLAEVPQWQASAAELENITSSPRLAAWLTGRDVLEDAFLQLFLPGTLPGGEEAILQMLDETILELAGGQP